MKAAFFLFVILAWLIRLPGYPVPPTQTPGDENWADEFGVQGLYSTAWALVVAPNGNLYAGGDFATAGGVTVNNVARWDGAAWNALGSGANNTVWALAVDASGNLYAGGDFTQIGGVTANHIAKWNGAVWSALGSGLDAAVYALAVDGGMVYAGGDFLASGATTLNRVARWNGAAWSAMGGADEAVYALTMAGSNLYAGGLFTTIGGLSVNYVAKWSGGAWSALGGGLEDTVNALAVDPRGQLYAGSACTLGGSCPVSLWNGTSWAALSGELDGAVLSLAFDSAGALYAGGEFNSAGSLTVRSVARWDGSAWSPLGSGANGAVAALAFKAAGDLYVGGAFSNAGGHTAYRISRWTAAVGRCGLGTPGAYTLYANNRPVVVQVVTPGTLDCVTVQRYNASHPAAPVALQTGFWWAIQGTTASGAPAANFSLNLTLPTSFVPDTRDQVCRYSGSGQTWSCLRSGHGTSSVVRNNVTQFSAWTVANDLTPAGVGVQNQRAHTRQQAPSWAPGAALLVGGMALLGMWWGRCRRSRQGS
jgi:hypothetical protein